MCSLCRAHKPQKSDPRPWIIHHILPHGISKSSHYLVVCRHNVCHCSCTRSRCYPAPAGQDFLLIFVGGLWAIVGAIIFPARKTSKQQLTVIGDPIQEQLQPQLTWQDKFRPLTSNLTIHSHYLQYAIVLAITGAVGMLIIQWFELSQGPWVLITVVNILFPAYSVIYLTINRVVHRTIGTIIGAIIAIMIIDSVQNIWLLTLIFFIFAIAYISFIKMKNYAFVVIFMTPAILLFVEIAYPTTNPTAPPLERIQNIFIGCVLSLVASSIWIAFRRKKSNLPLGRKRGMKLVSILDGSEENAGNND